MVHGAGVVPHKKFCQACDVPFDGRQGQGGLPVAPEVFQGEGGEHAGSPVGKSDDLLSARVGVCACQSADASLCEVYQPGSRGGAPAAPDVAFMRHSGGSRHSMGHWVSDEGHAAVFTPAPAPPPPRNAPASCRTPARSRFPR